MFIVWFLLNVTMLSMLLAAFEIYIEKDHGWATGFGPFWGKHYFQDTWLATICEKTYITRYHLVMFGIIVPLILYGEYQLSKASLIFFLASWIEICVVEDFLWFVMNWYYPGSLRQLFAGTIWWHQVYWKIGTIHLPRFYFLSSALAMALLLAQHLLNR